MLWRLKREPFLTEDCWRLLIDFLLRYPDASNDATISEVHRWLVGRVFIELRDEREAEGLEGSAAAPSALGRMGDRDGNQGDLKAEASWILDLDPPRDW